MDAREPGTVVTINPTDAMRARGLAGRTAVVTSYLGPRSNCYEIVTDDNRKTVVHFVHIMQPRHPEAERYIDSRFQTPHPWSVSSATRDDIGPWQETAIRHYEDRFDGLDAEAFPVEPEQQEEPL